MFETTKWNCPTYAIKHKTIIKKKWTYKFLLRLNKNLDEVRGRILGTKPLPNIREVALEVCWEESRKKVMMGSQTCHWGFSPSNSWPSLSFQWQLTKKMENLVWPFPKTSSHEGHVLENPWETSILEAISSSKWQKKLRNHVTIEDSLAPPNSCPFSKVQLELLQKMFNES